MLTYVCALFGKEKACGIGLVGAAELAHRSKTSAQLIMALAGGSGGVSQGVYTCLSPYVSGLFVRRHFQQLSDYERCWRSTRNVGTLRPFTFQQNWPVDRFFNSVLDYLEPESFLPLVSQQSGDSISEKFTKANTYVCQ